MIIGLFWPGFTRMSMSIEAAAPVIFGVLGLLVLALTAWTFSLSQQLKKLRTVWADLLTGTDGARVESMLRDQLRLAQDIREELYATADRVRVLEEKMRQAKRFVGVVRYNAFEDVGADQSFSLAVYDDDGNGAVLTSQVGREVCRVYGKQILAGKSDYTLSAEEQRAIEAAVQPHSRPRVGP
ncbi:MAG: DUF4446 family protein [Armatimonadota bacterium]